MRALKIVKYGKSEISLKVMETNIPQIGEDEILIQVKAASINPVDFKIAHGKYKMVQRFSFPVSIGYDYSGIVTKCGSNISQHKPGDEVFGCLVANSPGSIAEYCVSSPKYVTKKPAGISFEEAAALPLAGMTALQCFDAGNLKHGDKILIHAGSGGVGSLAIQIAKAKGAVVYTTTSSRNRDWVKALGADVVICYDEQNYMEECDELDMILDSLGGSYSKEAGGLIKSGGSLVNIAGGIDHITAKRLGVPWLFRTLLKWIRSGLIKKLRNNGIAYHYILMQSNNSDLKRLKQLVDAGELKPRIDRTYSIEDAVEAMIYLETGRASGKVVISL